MFERQSAGLFVHFPGASCGEEYLQLCVNGSVQSATERLFLSDIIKLIIDLAELGLQT